MDNLSLPTDPKTAKAVLDADTARQRLELDAGTLGRFFGASPNQYIVGAGSLALIAAGIIYTFVRTEDAKFPPSEFWKIIAPIVTTAFGYLMGASTRKREK